MGSSSCSSWLCITGSVVVAHRHSCSEACGLFPDRGWNFCLALWQVDCLPLSHQWSPTYFLTGNPFSSFFPLLPTHFLPSNFLIETRLEMSVTLGKDCYSRKAKRKKSRFSLLSIKSGCWNWWLDAPGGPQEAGRHRTEIKQSLTKGGIYEGIGDVQTDHNVWGDAHQIAPRSFYHSL